MKTPTLIHILGNGPSLSLFNRNDWSEDDLFVGCNFSNPKLQPDYTVIMDAKPMIKLFEGYKLSIPAVISDRCKRLVEKEKGGWRKLPTDAINVIDTMPMIHPNGYKYPMNSGHHATLYAIKQNINTVKEVHLWGFDSFWTDDISSNSDIHFRGGKITTRPRKPVVNKWRMHWDKIFADHDQHINFIIETTNKNLTPTKA